MCDSRCERRGGRFVPALTIWLLSFAAAGQGEPVFDRLTLDDGLSQTAIDSIVQDETGFIWIGTQDGLNRYDGYEFRIFRSDPADPSTINDNFIRALHVDREGALWVGTALGLNRYDPLRERFERIVLADDDAGNFVEAIVDDPQGRLWVATQRGLWRIAPDGERTRYLRNPERADSLAADGVRSLAVDREGVLWVGTARGLQFLPPGDERFLAPRVSPMPPAWTGDVITALYEDARGDLWIGTQNHGLYRLDRNRRRFDVWQHEGDQPDSLAGNEVFSVAQDRDGRIWVGTWGQGLDRLMPDESGFEHFRHDPARETSVAGDLVRDLFVDRGGTLWIGTHNLGVSKLNTAKSRFRRIGASPNSVTPLSSPGVFAILRDRDGYLWIGTDYGLNRINPAGDDIEHFHADGRPGSISSNFILSLHQDLRGDIWIGTRDGGLCRFRAPAGFACHQDGPAGEELYEQGITVIRDAPDGGLWVGVLNGGLWHFDPRNGAFRSWRHDADDPDSLSNNNVINLFTDSAGRVWVLTFGGGLNRFDPATGRFVVWRHDPDNPRTLSADRLSGIAQTEPGYLWLGTIAGLDRFDIATGDVRRWSVKDGLPNATVYSVLPDSHGHLWLSTNDGLSRFDPQTEEFVNFHKRDGLQNDEFNAQAVFRDTNGELWFGGIEGVTSFDPDDINLDYRAPPIVLTDLLLANQPVRDFGGEESLLPRAIAYLDRIELNHLHNVFSIEFAALEFLQPDGVRFEYRLDGFDRDWMETGPDRRIATYTNLNPGEYRFRVRAVSRGGLAPSKERRLGILVAPPPWRTGWAYAAYAAVLLLITGFFVTTQKQRMRLLSRHANELAASEQRLQLALWGSGDWLWDWNLETNEVYCADLARYLGYSPDDARSAERVFETIHPEDLPMVRARVEDELRNQSGLEMRFRARTRDGEWRWLLWRGKVVARDEQGRPVRMTGTCKDVTRQQEAETDLKLAARVLDNSSDAVAIIGLDFRFIKVNPAFTRVTGYEPEEIIGKPTSLLDSGRYTQEFALRMREAVRTRGMWTGEIWERRKNGDLYLSDLHLSAVTDEDGRATHYVAVFSDVTRRRKAEEELRYLANYDTLTGLPNRTLYSERLSHALVQARRHHTQPAVLVIDLDNFKQVNDTLGHAAGDVLLKELAGRLRATVREEDTVARLGGDEFGVIFEDRGETRQVADDAQRLLAELRQPVNIDGQDLTVTISIGISVYPGDGNDVDSLLKNADTAMYVAKERGRNAFAFYDPSMSVTAMGRLQLETLLRRALEREEFVVHYQPKFDLPGHRISGVEALVRWQSRERGLVTPDEFIPLAEERGLVADIGAWVLRQSCSDMAVLDTDGFTDIPLAVNLSVRQTMDPGLLDVVSAALHETRLPPQRLQLELTESLIMENAGETTKVLDALRRDGMRLVVDDFGTGYSSLSYLRRLPVDRIKVDKSFVEEILEDEYSLAIIRAIVAMARSLRLPVTAEGVEQAAQLKVLEEMGVNEVQGFLFAEPMPLNELREFLREYSTVRRVQ